MTFGDLRTKGEVAADAVLVARVKRGMELLKKEYGPDFVDHIDMSTFDIRSPNACILGQLYFDAEPTEAQWEKLEEQIACPMDDNGFGRGLAILDGDVPNAPYRWGFDRANSDEDYEDLQRVWEEALEAELHARQVH